MPLKTTIKMCYSFCFSFSLKKELDLKNTIFKRSEKSNINLKKNSNENNCCTNHEIGLFTSEIVYQMSVHNEIFIIHLFNAMNILGVNADVNVYLITLFIVLIHSQSLAILQVSKALMNE